MLVINSRDAIMEKWILVAFPVIDTDDVSREVLMDRRATNEGAKGGRMAIRRFCVRQRLAWRQQDAGLVPK